MKLLKVKFYETKNPDKYTADSEKIHEYICDYKAAFTLWFRMKELGYIHVEIRDLDGELKDPTKGHQGLL